MNDLLQKISTSDIPNVVTPKDLVELKAKTGSIYKSINIMAKRANQINQSLKKEILDNIEEFSSHTDSFDEIQENKEQIEISKAYERLPNPTLIAMREFEKNEIYFKDDVPIVLRY